MMKLCISTSVSSSMEKVFAGFDESLFIKLSPPFPRVKLERFDGCLPSDKVIIRLDFIFFKQVWESVITVHQATESEIYFIDKGVRLPFFLKEWEHKHRIIRTAQGAKIIDEIHYKAIGGFLGTLFFYPTLWLQFAYRKPIYQRVFGI